MMVEHRQPETISRRGLLGLLTTTSLAAAAAGRPSRQKAKKLQTQEARVAAAAGGAARGATIHVQADKILHGVTPRMIGVNLEDLNYQCYGGLYSQLLYGENFEEHMDSDILGLTGKDRLQVFVEENEQGGIELWGFRGAGWDHNIVRRILGLPADKSNRPVGAGELPPDKRKLLIERATGDEQVSRHWCKVQRATAKGTFQFERQRSFNGRQSQRITFVSGDGEIGMDNAGVNRWGIHLLAGKTYEGLLRIRAEKDCVVYVSLWSADGTQRLAEKAIELKAAPGEYQRVEFTLTPSAGDEHGRFSITLKQPATIVVGYAFLQPGPWGRFAGLPLRKDLVEAVIAQGVKVARYDGSMVSNCPDAHLYKWKEMIGPRDLRKPYHGNFNPYASHGFGIFDFLNLCEAAGFLPIPGVRIDETPQDMADFVEYVNDPAESPWAKKRTTNGHPKPYNLKHIEIGNEQRLDEYYCERFEALGEAIWSKDPDITLLVAHNLARASDWTTGPDGTLSELLKLAVRLVQFAKKRGGKIWWDCHYNFGTDAMRTADHPNSRIAAMRNLKESMRKLVPDYDFQIAPLEENGQNHNMERALGHAHNHNTFARMGDYLPAIAVANTLQAYQQEIIWSQGKTFFTSSKVWFQPPYYVDQMIAQNWASNVVNTDFTSPQDALDAMAKTTNNGKALVLQVVNLEPTRIETEIALDGFKPSRPKAFVTQIAGDLELENTLEEPKKIVPSRSEWEHDAKDGRMTYTFPPYSFTIVRFE